MKTDSLKIVARAFCEPLEPRVVLAAGDFDPSYGGGDGVTVVDQFAKQLIESGDAVAIQADGKILIAGSATDGFGRFFPDLLLVRLNADGTPDAGFGTGGQITFDFGGDYFSREEAFAVAVQADGKIVVAGRSALTDTEAAPLDYDVTLARFTATGAVDATFGASGFVRTDLGSLADAARGLAIAPGGQIYVVGEAGGDAAVLRYTSAGALDAGFASAGKLVLDFGGADSLRGAVLQGDGKLVAVGTNGADFAAIRLTTAGALDPAFGSAGRVLVDFAALGDTARAVALDASGRIVIGGSATFGTVRDYALARLTTAGALDAAFGTGGKFTFNVATDAAGLGAERIEGLAVQADGKIVVAGTAPGAFNRPQWHAARVTSSGALDAGFGTGGVANLSLDVATSGTAAGVALTGTGQLIIAGTRYSDDPLQPYSLGAMRLTTGGALDAGFHGDGVALFDALGSALNSIGASVALADGSVYFVEDVSVTPRNSLAGTVLALTHLLPDGTRDPAFGINGTVTVDLGASATRAAALAVQPDGRFLISGTRYFIPAGGAVLTGEGVLARLNANGTLDTTFGTGGIVTHRLAIGGFEQETSFADIALQPDGKVVVLEHARLLLGDENRTVISRYNPDGTLDTTFDTDGRVEPNIKATAFSMTSLNLLSDGKLLIAGTNDRANFQLVRLLADGSPDAAFGAGGTKAYDLKGRFADLSVNPDGSLYFGGLIDQKNLVSAEGVIFQPVVLGIQSDGALDLTFGNGGVLNSGAFFTGSSFLFARDAAGRFLFSGDVPVAVGAPHRRIIRLDGAGGLDRHFGSVEGIDLSGENLSYDQRLVPRPDGTLLYLGSAQFNTYAARFLGDPVPTAQGLLSFSFRDSGARESSGTAQIEVTRIGGDSGTVTVGFSITGGTAQPGADYTNTSGTLTFAPGVTSQFINIPLTVDAIGELRESIELTLSNPTGGAQLQFPVKHDVIISAHNGGAGAIDPNFGVNGLATINHALPLSSGNDQVSIRDSVMTPDGKILILGQGGYNTVSVGSSDQDPSSDLLIARLNADGTPDTTFGDNGRISLDFAFSLDEAEAISVLADGKIMVVGMVHQRNGDSIFNGEDSASLGGGKVSLLFARYNADGTLDRTYGDAGYSVFDPHTLPGRSGDVTETLGADFVIQPDGTIVAGLGLRDFTIGATQTTNAGAVLVRFSPDGTFDTAFAGDGVAENGLGYSVFGDLVLSRQPDGKYVMAIGQGDFADPLEETLSIVRYHADGRLDSTFGSGGKISVNTFVGPNSPEIPTSISFQQDGKILLAGNINHALPDGTGNPDASTRTDRGFIVRLNTNGSLDTSFSTDGFAFFGGLTPGVTNGTINAVTQLPSGQIAATGNSVSGTTGSPVTLNFLADGTPNPQFGINGVFAHTALRESTDNRASSLLVTPSNDIISIFGSKLASGNATTGDTLFALQRVTTQGAAGRLEWTLAASSVEESDGAVSVLVRRTGGTQGAVSVAYSFTAGTATLGTDFTGINGTLDFADGQSLVELLVPITRGDAVELTETFTITLAAPTGGATLGSNISQTISILDGPDRFEFASPTYGFLEGSRLVSIPVLRKGASNTAASVEYTLQGIEAVNGLDFDALEGGALFFAAGQATASITFALRADALPEGRETISIVLTGALGGPELGALTQAAVGIFDTQPGKGNNAGALDPRFDGDGISRVDVFTGGVDEQSRDLVVQPDGKIVVIGDTGGIGSDFLVARYLPGGSLDPSFGTGGRVTTDFFGGVDSAQAVTLDGLGRIVVTGWALKNGRAEFAVARYNANGTPDASFSTDGKTTVNFDGFDARATSLAIDGDGRIALAGVTSGLFKTDLALAVLDDNGALDLTFSGDGRVSTNVVNREEIAADVLFLPEGQILVGGTAIARFSTSLTTADLQHRDMFFARYTPAGLLDTSFDADGLLVINKSADASSFTTLNTMTLRPDGRVVFGGSQTDNIMFGALDPAGRFEFFSSENFTLAQLGIGPQFTSSKEVINDIVLAPDGSFYAAGSVIFPGETQQRLFVKHINADFTYDPGFGLSSNSVVTALGGGHAIGITPTGGIVTTGAGFEVAQLLQSSAMPPQGAFSLSAISYVVSETAGNLVIQVRRPHGNSEGFVSVDYGVVGITAQPGQDFTSVAGTLTFRESETIKTITIPIINDAVREFDELFGVVLTNPTGGAELASTSYAPVVIAANDQTNTAPGGFVIGEPGFDDFVFEGFALVTVNRTGGSLGAVTIDYHTEDGTAKAGLDYVPAFGTLSFAAGETSKQIFITTIADDRIEGTETFHIKFTTPTGGSTLALGFDTMTLAMPDSVPTETFPYAGNADATFDTDGRLSTDSGVTGPDNFFAAAQQPDGKLVAVGQAGSSGGFFLARYNANGALDTTFGTAGKTVTSLGSALREVAIGVRVQADGKILVVGASGADGKGDEIVFTRYTSTGALDKSFGSAGFARTKLPNSFTAATFVAGNYDVTFQADGKILLPLLAKNGFDTDLALVRFLPTGKLDTAFGTGGAVTYDTGFADDSGSSVSVQPDGKIVATFAFGSTRAVRFNADGSVDTSFADNGAYRANTAATLLSPGLIYTDNSTIHESLILPDGDVLLIGQAFGSGKPLGSALNFTEALTGGVLAIRLNADGTPDSAFGTGGMTEIAGLNLSQIKDALLDEAGKVVALGGNGFGRFLLDGRADPGFGVNGVGSSGFGSALLKQSDNRIVITGGNAFSNGDAQLSRFLGGSKAGALRLNVLTETIAEKGGMLTIPIERIAGLDGAVSVTFSTADGTATAGGDYAATTQVLTWADGETGVKFVSIPITDDAFADAAETFTFNLSAPTGGALLSTRSSGTATIVDDDQPGVFNFAQAAFFARENDGTTLLTVHRRDGDLGAVSVNYSVTSGTAVSGQDFTLAAGTLNFASGESSRTISVTLLDDATLGEDKTVIVTLAAPGGGATLGDVAATRLTIRDNETPRGGSFGFGATQLETREDSGGYLVTVLRTDGSDGVAAVNLVVSPGSAASGRDFIPFTTRLEFADGQTSVSAFIPIFDNADANPARTVQLSLDTPTGAAVLAATTQPAIGSDGAATLTISDNDAVPARLFPGSIQLITGRASERAGFAPLLLLRTDGSAGAVTATLQFTSGTAVAGRDFTATPIVVEFADGELSRTVFVPIRNDLVNEPGQTFNVAITGIVGGATPGATTVGTVTITDDDNPALRDFNNDGKLDLITQKGASFLLHVGDGLGGFAAVGTALPKVKGAKSYVHGDFNGDGNADLALLTSKSIVLLSGKGDGTFLAPKTFASNKSTKSLVTADFNSDGRPDLAALSSKGVNILLNSGNGFNTPILRPAAKALTITTGDFNEDGRTDLAVLTSGKTSLFTLINGGNGLFTKLATSTKFGTGVKAASIAVADFNRDGHLDVAAIVAKNRIAIASGTGGGVFRPVTSTDAGKGATLLAVADLDDDLDLDLLATSARKMASVIANNGNGTFTAPQAVNVAFSPFLFAATDLNGDEDPDLILATKKDKFKVAKGTVGTGLVV